MRLLPLEEIGYFLILISTISIIKNRNNYIIILLCLELILIGISLIFISSSLNLDDFKGIVVSIFLYTIGAIESAIGLSILIIYKNQNKRIG